MTALLCVKLKPCSCTFCCVCNFACVLATSSIQQSQFRRVLCTVFLTLALLSLQAQLQQALLNSLTGSTGIAQIAAQHQLQQQLQQQLILSEHTHTHTHRYTVTGVSLTWAAFTSCIHWDMQTWLGPIPSSPITSYLLLSLATREGPQPALEASPRHLPPLQPSVIQVE